MGFDEAMNMVRKACAEFRGNLYDHQNIQQALAVVEKECMKKVEAEAVEPIQE